MEINYSDQEVVKGKKSIFLAGPTPRGENVESWREEACEILRKKGFDGLVYVPEYSTWRPKEDYTDQAMWERVALTNATAIVFWIPRDLETMPAYTTNVEFGYWLHTGKVLYGRPDKAPKIKYLDWLYELDTDEKPIDNLEKLLEEAVLKAEELYDGKEGEILPLKERVLIKK